MAYDQQCGPGRNFAISRVCIKSMSRALYYWSKGSAEIMNLYDFPKTRSSMAAWRVKQEYFGQTAELARIVLSPCLEAS